MQVRAIHPTHERANLCELPPPPILCCHRAAPTDKPLERLRNRVESRLAQRPIQMRGFVRPYTDYDSLPPKVQRQLILPRRAARVAVKPSTDEPSESMIRIPGYF